MSAIAQTFLAASNYAINKVFETHDTYKVYTRIKADQSHEYIVVSRGSDIPTNAVYFGRFYWNGKRVVWIKRS